MSTSPGPLSVSWCLIKNNKQNEHSSLLGCNNFCLLNNYMCFQRKVVRWLPDPEDNGSVSTWNVGNYNVPEDMNFQQQCSTNPKSHS